MNKFEKIDSYDLMNSNGCEWKYQKNNELNQWVLCWSHPSGLKFIESTSERSDFEQTKIVLVQRLQSDLDIMLQDFFYLHSWLHGEKDEEDRSDDADAAMDEASEPDPEPIPALHWCIDKVFTMWSDGTITENFGHRFIEPEEILDFKGNLFPTYEEAMNHAIGYACGRVA